MSLNYSAIFTDIGRVIKQFNALQTQGIAYKTALAAIQSSASVTSSFNDAYPTLYNTLASDYADLRSAMAVLVQNRFTDYATVVGPGELDLSTSDFNAVMDALYEQMIADSASIQASTAVVGSVSANGLNVGNGTLLTTKLLDSTSPGSRGGSSMVAHYLNATRTTELIQTNSETMTVRVTADSYSDGVTEGAESLSWSGDIADTQFGIAANEGSGQISTITAIHGNTATYLQNADFEKFTVANQADSWTYDLGALGTQLTKSTSTNQVYHGTNSIIMAANASIATIQISQVLTNLVPLRMYCCTVRVRCSANAPAAGDFTATLALSGSTGSYTPGGSESVTIAAASLTNTFQLASFFVLIPANPPPLKLVLKWTGTPAPNLTTLDIDDVGFSPVSYGGGFGLMAVRGQTPFVRNDRFTFSTSSSEGIFQKFFRRAFGRMLPSAGSPSISDSLAT